MGWESNWRTLAWDMHEWVIGARLAAKLLMGTFYPHEYVVDYGDPFVYYFMYWADKSAFPIFITNKPKLGRHFPYGELVEPD